MFKYIVLIIVTFIYKSITAVAFGIDFDQSLKDIGILTGLLMGMSLFASLFIMLTAAYYSPVEIVFIAIVLGLYFIIKTYGKKLQKKDYFIDAIFLPTVYTLYFTIFYFLKVSDITSIPFMNKTDYYMDSEDRELESLIDRASTPRTYGRFMGI